MSELITDELFTTEFKILWQNSDNETKDELRNVLEGYFNEGERAYKLIEKMQEAIPDGN